MRLIRLGLTLPTQTPPEMIETWTCRCGKVHISLHWMKPPTDAVISCAYCQDELKVVTSVEAQLVPPRELFALVKGDA